MPELLKIVIDAEVNKAVSGLQKLKEEQALLNQEIADFTTALKKNDAAIASKIKELNALSKGSGNYRSETTRLNKELEDLRNKSVALSSGLKSSKTEFAGVNTQVKEYVREANRIRNINESASVSFARLTSVNAIAGQAVNQLRGHFVSLATTMVSGFVGGFVVSIISELLPALIKADKGFTDAELSALRFRDALDRVGKGATDLQSRLDFIAKVKDLQFRVKFGEGFAADVNQLKTSLEANNRFLAETDTQFQQLTKNAQTAENVFQQFRQQTKQLLAAIPGSEAKSAARQLAIQFESLDKIPKEAFDKLTGTEKSFIENLKANNEALDKLQKQRNRAAEENTLIGLQIDIRRNEEQKRLAEEAIRNQKKIKIKPAFELDPLVGAVELLKVRDGVYARLQELFNKRDEKSELDIFLNIKKINFPDLSEGFKKANEELRILAALNTGSFENVLNVLEGVKQKTKDAAALMNEVLTPAFQSFFDAMINGENPIKAFFKSMVQAINQVIQRLIAAAIQAAILTAITAGTDTPIKFGAALLKLFGGGGIANAGSLNALGGSISARSFANQVGSLAATTRVSGSDLLLVISRAAASQGRTG